MAVRWINVFIGAWLVVTSLLVGPRAPEFGDHLAIGLLMFLVAFFAMGIGGIRKLNMLLGVLLVLSPFVLDYTSSAFAVHDIVLGIIAAWAASTPTRVRADQRHVTA
jgi:hypothetical protein